jgi:hypothetical protein
VISTWPVGPEKQVESLYTKSIGARYQNRKDMLNREEGEREISKTHCQALEKAPKSSPSLCDPSYV